MKRLVDRFAEAAAACGDLNRLRELLHDAAHELGFAYFALLHHSSLASPGGARIRIDNYPEAWVDEMISRKCAVHDPVHLASRRVSSGFAWAEIGSIIALADRHRAIFSRSRDHGIGPGFTVPANVPGEPSGSCSFAVRKHEEFPRDRLMCAELVGAHAFRAARRIQGFAGLPARPHLSRREAECVRLVAAGKTDWEIGAILGISVETARQYVKRARAAYGVVSRAQLAAAGVRDEWVEFEEALPPAGR
jgi:LuxR family quorum-sensing system transcriptional regulator CciR